MSEYMSDRMPEYMPEYMTEYTPNRLQSICQIERYWIYGKYMSQHVLVRITQSRLKYVCFYTGELDMVLNFKAIHEHYVIQT